MTWRNRPSSFSLQLISEADDLTKKITGDMLTTVILATPIDTSAARQNWRVGVDSVNTLVDENETDGSGQGAISQGIRTIQAGGGIGKVVNISNSIKYIARLNDGYSMQAPKNFVQIAFNNVVSKYR